MKLKLENDFDPSLTEGLTKCYFKSIYGSYPPPHARLRLARDFYAKKILKVYRSGQEALYVINDSPKY